ncbi:MAG TPA: dATP/dGTP diphosphohydrolase domain-containing protein [Candidatus Acidoferrum sp.]|nr:dATP/dGTP diphosphohydrolase domain-containing protein [Candidatus Acidoferrum sp.]
MSKFKVGDVLEFVSHYNNYEPGDTVSVTSRDGSGVFFVYGNGIKGYAHDARFKLYTEVQPEQPTPAQAYAEASQASAPRGRKDDAGKLDMNLLDDMPRALKAITEVMQWAITEKKPEPYKRASWLGVHADRYRAAIKRHDREACEMATQMATLDDARFQRDKETNLLHLAHMACSAMMALENTLRDMEVYRAPAK